MTVTLTPQQEKLVTELMSRGEFASPEMVVEEALRLVQANADYQKRLAGLRAEIDIGLEQIKRGETVDAREVFARLREKNRQRIRG
ncbi:MAG TPA: type II toxin-antitoxin system ParD family antitoxin [Verrucomicrobiae bacterium]|nr:type II toxin-antitoxin system ParD family antitoxin [Verrucomicrobiae bacterium]